MRKKPWKSRKLTIKMYNRNSKQCYGLFRSFLTDGSIHICMLYTQASMYLSIFTVYRQISMHWSYFPNKNETIPSIYCACIGEKCQNSTSTNQNRQFPRCFICTAPTSYQCNEFDGNELSVWVHLMCWYFMRICKSKCLSSSENHNKVRLIHNIHTERHTDRHRNIQYIHNTKRQSEVYSETKSQKGNTKKKKILCVVEKFVYSLGIWHYSIVSWSRLKCGFHIIIFFLFDVSSGSFFSIILRHNFAKKNAFEKCCNFFTIKWFGIWFLIHGAQLLVKCNFILTLRDITLLLLLFVNSNISSKC